MVSSSPGSPQIPTLKRPRSDTAASGSMSPKRANSEVVEEDIAATSAEHEMDQYIRIQDAGDDGDIGLASMISLDTSTVNDNWLSGQERYQMIKNLEKMPLELGTVWYVVDRRWFKLWETAAIGGGDGASGPNESSIGPVNNSSLIHPTKNVLLPDLTLDEDYVLLPEAGWRKLVEWYGMPIAPLPREVVAYSQNELRVEVYPPVFRVYPLLVPNSDTPVPSTLVECSSLLHLSVLAARAAHALQIPTSEPYRVWNVPSQTPTTNGIHAADIERGTLVPIPADSKTPIAQFVKISDILVAETQLSSCEWPLDADSVTLPTEADAEADNDAPLFGPSQSWTSQMQTQHASRSAVTTPENLKVPAKKSAFSNLTSFRGKSPAPAVPRGTMGLQNLGNTCFMNSALQCLAHIPELDEYFLSGLYRHELNPDNPLGMQGQIANAFGALLHHLYPDSNANSVRQNTGYSAWGFGGGTSSSSYAPREFKQTLGRFAPAFSGYQQHDTQEFLGFLLDGLHEDLNRVLKKPYIEKPEWPEEGGGLDVEAALARETWEGYKKRNDSIIVDLFQGMYKSTLVCPECAKVSITFDPFMYLTLPLPITKTWRHVVHYVPWDNEKEQLAVQIEVPKDSSFGYLKKMFGRWFDVDPENLLAAEVWSRKFYKYYDDYLILTDLTDKDVLVIYELPIPLKSAAKLPQYGKFTNSTIAPSSLSKPAEPPADDAPFILPVTHTAANQRGMHSTFGVPFIVVLTPTDASSREGIYRAVVERAERWTRKRSDLWKYRGLENPIASEEELVAIRPADLDSTVTEIRPDGDDVTVEVVPDTDMDAAQSEIAETLASDIAPTLASSSERDPFEVIGPQEGLFDLRIYASGGVGGGMETGFNMNPLGARFVDWTTRESVSDIESEDGDAPRPALVKPNDVLVCQWPHPTAEYFFTGEDSLFDRWEPFVHPEVEALRASQTKSRSGKRAIDIEDCLNEFTKEEQLGEDDLWYCPRCKKHQQATKKFELWSVPDILVVHLKRFSNARAMRDKIDALVDFPTEGLDLGQRIGMAGAEGLSVGEEYVYDLFAVDEHMGGLGGGHYRAYAKNQSDNEWYHFDDSYVSKSYAEDSVNSNAYLLFYRRRAASSNGVIDKVRARIEGSPDLGSSKTIDMATEPVHRASSPVDELPSFEAASLDTLVPPSAYDGQYRSHVSDEDPFTNPRNTPSPGSVGSNDAAYDSSEDKELAEHGFGAGFQLSGTVRHVEVVQDTTHDGVV